MTVLERLKQETAGAHRRIEAALDIDLRTRSMSAYRALLARFHGYFAAWEPRALWVLGEERYRRERDKTALIRQDLRALGLKDEEIAELPVCGRLPSIETRSQAWGSLYVMEGSTLGGRIISRLVEQRLGLSAATGCAYFSGYAGRTDEMWSAFRALVLAESAKHDEREMVTAATATFETLRVWLSE